MSSATAETTTSATYSDLTLLEIMRTYGTEEAARGFFERLRWPDGPQCPYCTNADQEKIYKVAANAKAKTREGLYKCAACKQQFTVTVGTVMHDSHVPLTKWLLGFYLMASSKTQMSALQLQRHLELGSYRTAWHLCHRIRYAMAEMGYDVKMHGEVEVDETYIGGRKRGKGRGYKGNKVAIVSMVQRGGKVRSKVVPTEAVTKPGIAKILKANVSMSASLMTDESGVYMDVGKDYSSHDTVNHAAKEYGRHDLETGRIATTNAAEGFFGNSKRALDGTHHHVSKKHLPLYVAELDYKYNQRKVSDGERTIRAINRAEGKRLSLKPLIG